MPIMFNSILRDAGIPLKEVRLLRHKDKQAKRGFTPFELWRDNKQLFERYQSTQSISNRKKLNSPYWAVFVVNASNETIFAGLYSVQYIGILEEDTPMVQRDAIDKAGTCDLYHINLESPLSDLIGKLVVGWGTGTLAWVQYADRNDKPVMELHKSFVEPDFPGFMNFIIQLSAFDKLPKTWVAILKTSRGVYLLTCPKTKEQYVGSASGEDGFWGRWKSYHDNGHGENIALKSRNASDYQVSILEVASSSATSKDIQSMEGLWQSKLQSQEMGLNRNSAKRHHNAIYSYSSSTDLDIALSNKTSIAETNETP